MIESFPSSYLEARKRFLDLAARHAERDSSIELRRFQVPSKTPNELYVDDFYRPPTEDFETLILLTSGVHGIEGPTGSAIQFMFLEKLFERCPQSRVGVHLIHSINPYGYQFGRRATENNINLNRGFAADPLIFDTPNDGYRKIHNLFSIAQPVSSLAFTRMQTYLSIAKAIALRGFTPASLNQALGQGQYEFKHGLEYGGQVREPQVEFIVERLKSIMPKYRNIILFDLHTGLGDPGVLHVIPGDANNGLDPSLLKKLFHEDSERDLYKMTPTNTPGFYQTTGDFNSMIPALATAEQKVLALTFEFGTLGNSGRDKLEVLSRIRLENQGFCYGYKNEAIRQRVNDLFADLFFPKDKRWQSTVLGKAENVLTNVVTRI